MFFRLATCYLSEYYRLEQIGSLTYNNQPLYRSMKEIYAPAVYLLPEHLHRLAMGSVTHSPAAIEAAREAEKEGTTVFQGLSDDDIKALMKLFGFKGTLEEFISGHYELSAEEKVKLARIKEHERAMEVLMDTWNEYHMAEKPEAEVVPSAPADLEQVHNFFEALKEEILKTPQSDT